MIAPVTNERMFGRRIGSPVISGHGRARKVNFDALNCDRNSSEGIELFCFCPTWNVVRARAAMGLAKREQTPADRVRTARADRSFCCCPPACGMRVPMKVSCGLGRATPCTERSQIRRTSGGSASVHRIQLLDRVNVTMFRDVSDDERANISSMATSC